MSNNNHDFTDIALQHAKNNKNNVIGFITQKRIDCDDLICMTPGISTKETNDKDQKYRTSSNVDTDIIIVGRAIYNSPNIEETISSNRHGMSLWRFFLLIAIILYTIESFLSRPKKNLTKN